MTIIIAMALLMLALYVFRDVTCIEGEAPRKAPRPAPRKAPRKAPRPTRNQPNGRLTAFGPLEML